MTLLNSTNQTLFYSTILIILAQHFVKLSARGISKINNEKIGECGGFLTETRKEIDLSNLDTESEWGKLKYEFEDEVVSKIVINSPNAIVRVCSLYEGDCQTFDHSIDKKYDVASIVSAICGYKKDETCNSKCADVKLRDDECARFYQSRDCEDCTFNHVSLPHVSVGYSKTVLHYQIVESVVVKNGCDATIGYNDTSLIEVKTGNLDIQQVLPVVTYHDLTLTCSCLKASDNEV